MNERDLVFVCNGVRICFIHGELEEYAEKLTTSLNKGNQDG